MRIALLHGFAGEPHAWDEVIAAWPRGDDLVAPALPIRESWDASLAALELDAELVVGYSLGARVALGLLAKRRIERAILISVNPGIDDTERPARRAGDAKWAALLRTQGMAGFLPAWEAQPLFATQVRVARERIAARNARRLALDPELVARSLETMGLAEMPDYRGTSLANVTLVAGADDAKFLAISRALPAPLEIVEGSGHDPTLEQPERLAALLVACSRP
jgi:2-succinyl-6-hydroxy-2,4-cyclohexadiene-1-carboxylate synthase